MLYNKEMRQARITYKGTIHHGMNRGHDGLTIFKTEIDKEKLLEFVKRVELFT